MLDRNKYKEKNRQQDDCLKIIMHLKSLKQIPKIATKSISYELVKLKKVCQFELIIFIAIVKTENHTSHHNIE